MEKKALELTLDEFIEALNSAAPTPSGGAATAATMAIGFSLIRMSALISIKKMEDANKVSEINNVLDILNQSVANSKLNIQQDIDIFNDFMKAYKSKDNNEISRCGKLALKSPLTLIEVATKSTNEIFKLKPYIKENIFSDYLQGLILICSALEMAYINVLINKDFIDNVEDIGRVLDAFPEIFNQCDLIRREWFEKSEAVFGKVDA